MTDRNKRYFNFNSSRQPATGAVHYPFLKVLPAHLTADSIDFVSGGAVTGTVADIQDEYDGNVYSVAEAAATPGFEFVIKFANIPFFKFIRLIAAYEGSATHAVIMQLYDFGNTVYHTKRIVPTLPVYSLTPGEVVAGRYDSVIEDSTPYISGGEVWMRIIHVTGGNSSQDIHILYASLF